MRAGVREGGRARARVIVCARGRTRSCVHVCARPYAHFGVRVGVRVCSCAWRRVCWWLRARDQLPSKCGAGQPLHLTVRKCWSRGEHIAIMGCLCSSRWMYIFVAVKGSVYLSPIRKSYVCMGAFGWTATKLQAVQLDSERSGRAPGYLKRQALLN